MNVAPAAEYEALFAAGVSGLIGTVALGLLDNQGAFTEPLSTAAIIETPAGSGIYAATRTAPDTEGQYTLLWSIDGTTAPEQLSIDELRVTSSAPGDPVPPPAMYGTVAEAFRRAKIKNPTPEQQTAMQRDLVSASLEVNSEIDRVTDLAAAEYELATEVALERAIEHWQQGEMSFGIWENAVGPIVVGRDTWDRHALKLAPLKQRHGIA